MLLESQPQLGLPPPVPPPPPPPLQRTCPSIHGEPRQGLSYRVMCKVPSTYQSGLGLEGLDHSGDLHTLYSYRYYLYYRYCSEGSADFEGNQYRLC